jgi:hypothetical protein
MMAKALALTLERLRELSFDLAPSTGDAEEVKPGARARARSAA